MHHVMGKILAAALCLLVALPAAPAAAFGDEPDTRAVTVGVFEFDGYHMQDADGNLSGYGIELLHLIERYSHLDFKLVGYDCSWADMLEMLDNGEIDMVTTARQTPERLAKYAFSLPIGTSKTMLSVQLDNRSVVAGDISTYNGMTIGVIPGSSQNETLEAFAEQKGFTYDIVEFEEVEDMEEALQRGEIDAILSSDLRKGDDEKVIDTIDVTEFYAITRKDDTELIDEIDYAIEQIDLHEGDWKNVLYYRFYGPNYTTALDFTEREKAYIAEVQAGEKTITATAAVDRIPYSYVENGELRGILLDYFAAVMEVAELPYEIVVPQDAEEYLSLVENDGVDIVIDAMVDTTDIELYGDEYDGFDTDPYMETGFAIVTEANSNDRVQVIAVDDSQTEEIVAEHVGADVEVVKYPTVEDAMQAVIDDKADAAYVYSYSAQQLINKDKTHALHFGIVHDLTTEFAMHVRDTADHELVTILDKCIQLVPRSKLDQLISEYTTYSLNELSFEEFTRAHPALVVLTVLLILITIAVVLALFMRYRWNRRLLRAQEDSNKELGDQLAIVDALSRDYTNVFAVNAERGMARVVKLEGYVTEGLQRDADVETEYDYDDILTRYIATRVHPEDRAGLTHDLALSTVREALPDDSAQHTGTYRILSDGEEHHYQYVCRLVERPDGASFILAGFRNIDETIKNEQEQKELLAEALTRAQYANRAKTTFLNSMSHDIRTPMNAIIGFTSLATTNMDDPDQVRDYLDKIMTSSNHLLSLINDVLDMSRIESGKVKLEEKETSLPDMLRDLEVIVQTDIGAKQLGFAIEMVDVRNEVIICDKLRLNQVLLNILSNAMKYTAAGGMVTLRVVQTSGVQDGCADYAFHVKDTGIGMSQEFLGHVFEPFERENTATVSGIQGTGLGLAITKNIVDIMGGEISVESEEGVGSEFTVRFRFRVSDALPEPRSGAGSSDPRVLVMGDDGTARTGASGAGVPGTDAFGEDARFDGKRILVVEDNELNLEIAQALLEGAGIIVDTADDGTVAVEKLEQSPAGTYDLILTDVQMPIMDGYEETRVIRAMDDPAKASIPIVAMTANAFEEDREEAIAAGMSGYVHKPINIKDLMNVLREFL